MSTHITTSRPMTTHRAAMLFLLLGSGTAWASPTRLSHLGAGDLVVSEVMVDTTMVDDAKGEWLEITNLSASDVDLQGLVLSDDGGDHATISTSVVVAAGGRAVLAANSSAKKNGGIPTVDATYTRASFKLDDGADEVHLSYGSTVFDSVAWGGTTGIHATPGAALNLDIDHINATDNDKAAFWCDAKAAYGSGDLGTPGTANDDCGPDPLAVSDLARGDLVLSEVMIQPTKVSEAKGEWFEIYNNTGLRVNLNGLVIEDDGSDHFEVPQDFIAVPGAYVLLAAKASPSANGGLPTVDIAYTRSALSMDNTADEIVLWNGAVAIDEIAWTASSGVPSGATWSLDPGHLDADSNDDASSWCAESDTYGLGDAGTPGAANSVCGDGDGDGYLPPEDCDDSDPNAHPGGTELCNDVDDDCDGFVDDGAIDAPTWSADHDEDGYGDPTDQVSSCENPDPDRYVGNASDCDDSDPEINPDASEVCGDGVDNDCDGTALGCEPGGDVDLGSADARFEGSATYTDAGSSLSGVGDLNGDGNDDLCVGAPSTAIDAGASSKGAAYVVLGPVSGEHVLGSDADATFKGEAGGDQAGSGVSGAGDLDGDGYGDLLVGARDAADGGKGAGAVYVAHGPFAGSSSLGDADGLLAGAPHDMVGVALSGGGDVDGDGVPDIVAGAYGDSAAGAGSGAVYIVESPVDGTRALEGVEAILSGEGKGDAAGRAVASRGDVDGDGIDDLMVGAPSSGADGVGSKAGRAYLMLGPISGSASLGDADTILSGTAANQQAGYAVDNGGDLNGDGAMDLLVSGLGACPHGTNSGEAWVVYGPVTGSVSLGSADVTLNGVATGDHAGADAAFAGDVNGDGADDVLVGAYGQDSGGSNAGATYLLYGPLLGTESLSAADARFLGEARNDKAGTTVAAAGDVNADGYSDVLTAAPAETSGGANAGAAYLILGNGI